MLKGMAWSLLSGGFLAAGFAYVYAQRARARARRVAGDSERRLLAEDGTRSQLLKEALEEPLPADAEEIEIELLDLDLDLAEAQAEAEEAYDSTSPDALGALWLARATQTSGVHTSPGIEEDFDTEDDLDPAGRPTQPPEERRGLTAKK